MAPRIQFDPVPSALAGVLTAKCECGWEVVTIQPEESIWLLQTLFVHLIHAHEIKIPEIIMTWH